MSIDAKGNVEGIIILWNPIEIIVDYWISMKIILKGQFQLIWNREWLLVSALYDHHIPTEKRRFLLQLQQLGKHHKEKLWMIRGDFNLITSIEKKKWGLQIEEPEMERFKDLQAKLKLVDIPTINGKYSCNNWRGGSRQIACMLDRFSAIEHFIGKYIFYEATILPCLVSDHWPIKLEIVMSHQN